MNTATAVGAPVKAQRGAPANSAWRIGHNDSVKLAIARRDRGLSSGKLKGEEFDRAVFQEGWNRFEAIPPRMARHWNHTSTSKGFQSMTRHMIAPMDVPKAIRLHELHMARSRYLAGLPALP